MLARIVFLVALTTLPVWICSLRHIHIAQPCHLANRVHHGFVFNSKSRYRNCSIRSHDLWRPLETQRDSSEDEYTVVILYNKPRNLITSHSNNDAVPETFGTNNAKETKRKTVYDDIFGMKGYVEGCVPPSSSKGISANESFEQVTGIRSKLHAVGRLDAETTGILLLTNDGGLVHHATNPSAASHVESETITKTYEAVVMGHHNASSPAFEQIRTQGVDIGSKYGGVTTPAKALRVLGYPSSKTTLVCITISEGKNRHVRRMFHGVGSGVIHLHRSGIGERLRLGELEEGQWRILSDKEVWEGLRWRPRTLVKDSREKRAKQSTPRRRRRRKR